MITLKGQSEKHHYFIKKIKIAGIISAMFLGLLLAVPVKTYASDLNPIAATGLALALKLTPGISEAAVGRLLTDIKIVGDRIRSISQRNYQDSNVLAYFWARTYDCPHCGHKTPLIQSKWLSKTGIKRSVLIDANKKTGKIVFSIVEPKTENEKADADKGTVRTKSANCVFCDKATPTPPPPQSQSIRIA